MITKFIAGREAEGMRSVENPQLNKVFQEVQKEIGDRVLIEQIRFKKGWFHNSDIIRYRLYHRTQVSKTNVFTKDQEEVVCINLIPEDDEYVKMYLHGMLAGIQEGRISMASQQLIREIFNDARTKQEAGGGQEYVYKNAIDYIERKLL